MQGFQQRCDAYTVCNDIVQFGDSHAFLLHGITVTQSHAVVFQSLMVYSYAVRSTNGILTAVTLADGVFLVVLAMEVELQVVDDFACLFGQSVFLYQRHHSQLHRSQGSGKFQYYARFTILQLLFTIGSRHDAEEHAVYTNRGLDDVRGIAFVGFRVEILDVLAGELLMLGQVEIRTAVDAFHFLEAEGHQELDVRSRIGVVSQLVVVVVAVMVVAEAQRLAISDG